MKLPVLSLVFIVCITASINRCASGYNSIFNEVNGDLLSTLVEGSTRFSLELLKALTANQTADTQSRDLFFSPYSVWSALVVTYMGARGSTRNEMRKVLGVGDRTKAETWKVFKKLRHLNPEMELDSANFNSANRIYFQKGTSLKRYIRKMLYGNVAFVDFRNKTEEARKKINTWVERNTRKKIKDLIPRESIDKMTKMVIANAVFFKEEWLQPFEPQNTSPRKFTTSSRQPVFVRMMSTKGLFLHGESEKLQCSILEIPYSDNSLSMLILLPNDKFGGLDNLTNSLTTDALMALHESMLPKEVLVSIPKFKVEDTFELSAALKDIGLKRLFDRRRVNLSGFTGRKEFRLDSVRHKTLIDVNEEGTEAAASTDLFHFRSFGPSGRVTFAADHPFLYLIQDNISNVILFLGTVRKPPECGLH